MNINRERIVKVIALKRQYKQAKKFFGMCPVINPHNPKQLLTGIEILTEEQQKNVDADVLNQSDQNFNIYDGQTLDLKDDYQFMIYLRCLLYDNIAKPDETRNQNHLFYLHDEEYAAQKEAEKTDNAFEAIEYVMKFTDVQMRDIAIYCGIDINNVKSTIIRSLVKNHCMSNPEEILRYKNHDNRDNEMIIRKAVAYGIIRRRINGYFLKEDFVASTVGGCVNVLFKKENAHLKSSVINSIAAHENPGNKKSMEHLTKEYVDEKSQKKIKEQQEKTRIVELKYEYLKLAKEEYEGPETVSDITNAIEAVKLMNSQGDSKDLDFGLEDASDANNEKVQDFLEKCEEWEVPSIKKSLQRRGVPSADIDDIEDKNELIEIGVKFIRKN